MGPETKNWLFVEQSPMLKQRDPIQGQFFDTESIRSAANALVREAVQNSLDAGLGNGPVRVRLFVSEGDSALDPSSVGRFFDGMWDHLDALCTDDEQIAELEAMRARHCRFLVYEDFNTTGLIGDALTADEPEPGEANDYFYFWRAEGKSGKGGTDRGRWGVGKYVFPAASRVSTIFGFTIRSGETAPLMMGQAVLRNHQLDGVNYTPDAWWADIRDGVPVSVQSGALVQDFVKTWALSRKPGESGLSLVVPFIHEEVTTAEIMRSVVRDYFAAIVLGVLVVEVDSGEPGGIRVVDDESIAGHAALLDDEGERRDLLAGIEMVRWRRDTPELLTFDIPEHDAQGRKWSPGWTADLIPEQVGERARTSLAAGEPVLFRVPVLVGPARKGRGSAESSYFDVILWPEKGNSSPPLFVREGILVSEAQLRAPGGTSLRDYRAMVFADDPPLARMLGDAEGPAHTTWSERTPRFKGSYWLGPEWLKFVKHAPWKLLQLVEGSDDEVDRQAAADIFFIEEPKESGSVPRPSPSGAAGTAVGSVEGSTQLFDIHAVAGGFVISPSGGATCPEVIKIRAAYDVMKGDPFKKWKRFDFDFGQMSGGPTVAVQHGAVLRSDGNQLEVSIDDPAGFRLEVRGLGTTRDVIVDIRGELLADSGGKS